MFLFIYHGSNLFIKDANKQDKRIEKDNKDQEIYWPIDEWRTFTPEEQGIDSEELSDIIQFIIASMEVCSLKRIFDILFFALVKICL